MRTTFNKCLNTEPKIYNISYVSLMGGASAGITGACLYGFLGFFGGFVVGFVVGKKAGEAWWVGSIQRYIYWNLPHFFTSVMIEKGESIPPSHVRKLL